MPEVQTAYKPRVLLLSFAYTDAKVKDKLLRHGTNLEWSRLKHEAWVKSGIARDSFFEQGKSCYHS